MKLETILAAGAIAVALQFSAVGPVSAESVTIGTNFFDVNGVSQSGPALQAGATTVISVDESIVFAGIGVSEGTYVVTNNTQNLILNGFGVSGIDTSAFLGTSESSQNDFFYDYDNVLTLTDDTSGGNWNTELVFNSDSSLTFKDIFGAFADNIDTGDNTINWYGSGEIGLTAGDTSSNDYLKFLAPEGLASTAIGVVSIGSSANPGNALFFSNNINNTVVPVPAALPLFGTGLAIMGFIGWRRKRKATA